MNKVLLKKYLLLAIVSVVLAFVFVYFEKNNRDYSWKVDKSKGLTENSIQLLKSLTNEKAVKFQVYTQKDSAVAKQVKQFFKPFKRVNNAIMLEFVDPIESPSKVKQNAITMQGEIVLTYLDEIHDKEQISKINITELSETAVINAVLKLQNNKDEWIVFAEGYGMMSIDDETTTGLTGFLIHLKKTGFHVARMPLNVSLVLPENVKVIVLPKPTEILDVEIVNWLTKQMEQGISIWWLTDVDAQSQPQLELATDIIVGGKTLISKTEFADSLADYTDNPITKNFNQPIYIAEANQIIGQDYSDLINTESSTVIAVSKELQNNRVVITGDADFISNQYLNIAANKSFAMRIVDWLFYHDDRVNISVQINENTQLYLTQTQLIGLSLFFLIILPLIFLFMAWKQYRASRA